MRATHFRLGWLLVSSWFFAACAPRYEYRSACERHPNPEPPAGQSALGWIQVADTAEVLAVSGRVINVADGRGLEGSQVHVFDSTGTAVADRVTDNDGRFTLQPMPPGSYRMRVRRLGVQSVTAVFQVRTGHRVAIVAAMAPQGGGMMDGCGLFQERVQLPWWKFW